MAKLHKLHERISERRAVENKDAHDIYRLLVAIPTADLAAVEYLAELFSSAPSAAGSLRAGAAEAGIGDPAFVAQAASLLAADLTATLSDAVS